MVSDPMAKDTFFCPKRTLNCRGKIINLSTPALMGILNLTPDSFFDGGRFNKPHQALDRVGTMYSQGMTILDLGAASSRPGSPLIDPQEEQRRLLPIVQLIQQHFPELILSVDTYWSDTAIKAIDAGAHMINDISAGEIDPKMHQTIASLQVPYIMMHMKGTPENMQRNPAYQDVVKEVISFFSKKIHQLKSLGVHDLVVDPGFGFGKDLEHNYQLLRGLEYFHMLEVPILIGVSRKSMINKVLSTEPHEALNGTTVVHTLALQKGVHILRVHDVKEAAEAIKIVGFCQNKEPIHYL